MLNDFLSATGSSSFSSSAAAASAETGSSETSVDSRFFSLSESSNDGAPCEGAFSCSTGRLIARVGSKSKSSGHYWSSTEINPCCYVHHNSEDLR